VAVGVGCIVQVKDLGGVKHAEGICECTCIDSARKPAPKKPRLRVVWVLCGKTRGGGWRGS
jgi:hypothetical protein